MQCARVNHLASSLKLQPTRVAFDTFWCSVVFTLPYVDFHFALGRGVISISICSALERTTLLAALKLQSTPVTNAFNTDAAFCLHCLMLTSTSH